MGKGRLESSKYAPRFHVITFVAAVPQPDPDPPRPTQFQYNHRSLLITMTTEITTTENPPEHFTVPEGHIYQVKRKCMKIVSAIHQLSNIYAIPKNRELQVRIHSEPDNIADPHALALFVKNRSEVWVKCGYVPKESTDWVRDTPLKEVVIINWIDVRTDQPIPCVLFYFHSHSKEVPFTEETWYTPSVITTHPWVHFLSPVLNPKTKKEVAYGKWIVNLQMIMLDVAWRRTLCAISEGKLGKGCIATKCSTSFVGDNCTDSSISVIIVYTDRKSVDLVGKRWLLTGLKNISRTIGYKKDDATMKGQYFINGYRNTTTKTMSLSGGHFYVRTNPKPKLWNDFE